MFEIAVVTILLFVALLAGSVWIGLSLFATGYVLLSIFKPNIPMEIFSSGVIWGSMIPTPLLSLPLFILMSEVLVAARDLVDGRRVTAIEGGLVEYVHLLFDRHQVVWSEGLQTESFLPGPQTTHCFEEETLAEICQIFPDLDLRTGEGYGPAARPALKKFEARLLVA